MDPFGFAAGLLHGRDPAVALDLVSSLVAIALRPEGYDQARDQRGPSSRQRSKQPAVGVGQHELGDALVESRDLVAQSRQQPHQTAGPHGPRFQHRPVLGRWYGLVDGLNAFFHAFLATTVMLVEELVQRAGVGPPARALPTPPPAPPHSA